MTWFGWGEDARITQGARRSEQAPRKIRTDWLVWALLAALGASSAAAADEQAGGGDADKPPLSEFSIASALFDQSHTPNQVWEPFTLDALFRRRTEVTPRVLARVGSFDILGSLIGTATYNGNFRAPPGAPRSDVVLSAVPELRAVSQWSRHSLEVFAGGEFQAYRTHDDDNQANGFIGLNGIVDVYHDFRVLAQARCAVWHEERGYGGSMFPFTNPVQAETCNAAAFAEKEFSRVRVSAGVRTGHESYGDAQLQTETGVVTVSQSSRTGQSHEFVSRVGYELLGSTSLFVESSYNWRQFDDMSFNSNGYRLLGGVQFEITEMFRGELAAGWMSEDYDSALRESISTYTYQAQVEWRPTELVSMSMVSSRYLGQPGSYYGGSSRINTDVGAMVNYAWRSNVQLSAGVGFGWLDYTDQNHTDEYIRGQGGLNYQISDNVNLSMNYVHEDYLGTPNTLFDDSGRDSFTLSLTARY